MSDFIFNTAKGRFVELYNRVKAQDPATSRLVVLALATAGLESDAVLRDKDTVADLVSGATNEVTNSGYARKTLTAAALASLPAPDDTNDRYDIDLPDQTFNSIVAGDGWSKIIIAYIAVTGGADSTLVPLIALDFVATPDGNNIVVQFNTAGVGRAS